jgi:hypothetical protein
VTVRCVSKCNWQYSIVGLPALRNHAFSANGVEAESGGFDFPGGTFSRSEFGFDRKRNVYICPVGEALTTSSRVSAAPDGGSNCSNAAAVKVQSSRWRLVTPRAVLQWTSELQFVVTSGAQSLKSDFESCLKTEALPCSPRVRCHIPQIMHAGPQGPMRVCGAMGCELLKLKINFRLRRNNFSRRSIFSHVGIVSGCSDSHHGCVINYSLRTK